MAFAIVDHQQGGHVQGFQRVPQFKGLRGRTFGIAFAHQDESRRFYILDKFDRGTFPIDGWIVIDRGSEEGLRPLILNPAVRRL